MKLLVTCRDSVEAYMIVDELEREGVRGSVQGETLAFGRGDLPMTPQTLPQVWVNDEDFAAARVVAERFFAEQAEVAAGEAGPAWRCAKCGEEIEGQFGVCWNCGQERAGDC